AHHPAGPQSRETQRMRRHGEYAVVAWNGFELLEGEVGVERIAHRTLAGPAVEHQARGPARPGLQDETGIRAFVAQDADADDPVLEFPIDVVGVAEVVDQGRRATPSKA